MQIDEKKKIVEDLREKLSKYKVLIVTDYKGLNVTTINELRRKLREAAVEYKVAKNSLLVRASEDTDVSLISENFKGPSAIAISYDDPVVPAKILMQFAKDNAKLEIKAAVMDGKVLDLSAIKALSELPSQEVLLGKLLSVLNGVSTSLVIALNNIPKKLLNVLNAVKEQKEAA
ncbi:MAG: 50S ribosomal protein L10 [Deltaproteobacteria bacterium]|nr:50S ribosomal protein L10 [Deltaproteobacteria bacterium]